MSQTGSSAPQHSAASNISVSLFALDRVDEHFTARIETFSEQNVQLRVQSHLRCGRQLVMSYEGRRTELEVISCCPEKAGTYRLDCRITLLREGAVRNEWRMPVDWPARVEIPPDTNGHKARVRDVSVFGLGIELQFEPELGSFLTVNMQSGVGSGRVRHRRKIAHNTYFVGLYLEQFVSKVQDAADSGNEECSFPRSFGRSLLKAAQSIAGAVTRYRNRT